MAGRRLRRAGMCGRWWWAAYSMCRDRRSIWMRRWPYAIAVRLAVQGGRLSAASALGVTVNLTKFPLSPLVGLGRNMGWGIPAELKFDGTAMGLLVIRSPDGAAADGRTADRDAGDAGGWNTPPLRIASADLRFADGGVTLRPAAVTNESDDTATLEALGI